MTNDGRTGYKLQAYGYVKPFGRPEQAEWLPEHDNPGIHGPQWAVERLLEKVGNATYSASIELLDPPVTDE